MRARTLVAYACALMAGGCRTARSTPPEQSPATPSASAEVSSPAAVPEPAEALEPDPASKAEAPQPPVEPRMQLTGVPACDAYLARYRRCVEESAPENIRDTMLKAIDESHRAFIEEAKAPVNHPRMSRACEAALEAVRHNGASWGCVP